MKVGLCTISNQDRDVVDLVDLAGDVGFDGVEIWGKDHVGDGSKAACETIVDVAADAGVDVAVYGSYLRAAGDRDLDAGDDSDGRLDDDAIDREFEIADRLGADLIRIWAGSHNFEDVDDDYFDAVVADVQRIGDRAEAYGVDVTVEKHANTVANSCTGARDLIEAVGQETVGLNYQPNHWFDQPELEAEAAALAPLSNHMHTIGVHEKGTTDYDFEGLLEEFSAVGYDGYFNVEFVADDLPYEDSVRADHEFLRSLLDC
jgi:sugar phosphate isomerase/epimerase